MSSTSRCRAKDPVHCRVHGSGFVSYLDAGRGVFLPNPADDTFLTHEASERFAKRLSARERAAVTAYCDQEFSMVSLSLYDQGEYELASGRQGVHPDVEHLDSALAKHAGGESKVVYRATNLYGQRFSTPDEAAAYVINRYPVGSRFTVPGFMSTTTNPDALFDFMTESYDDRERKKTLFSSGTREDYVDLHNGDLGLSNIVYEIETPSGVPVSSLGAMHAVKEQEYLLARGKTFEVVDVRPVTKLHKPEPHPMLGVRHATVIRLREVV